MPITRSMIFTRTYEKGLTDVVLRKLKEKRIKTRKLELRAKKRRLRALIKEAVAAKLVGQEVAAYASYSEKDVWDCIFKEMLQNCTLDKPEATKYHSLTIGKEHQEQQTELTLVGKCIPKEEIKQEASREIEDDSHNDYQKAELIDVDFQQKLHKVCDLLKKEPKDEEDPHQEMRKDKDSEDRKRIERDLPKEEIKQEECRREMRENQHLCLERHITKDDIKEYDYELEMRIDENYLDEEQIQELAVEPLKEKIKDQIEDSQEKRRIEEDLLKRDLTYEKEEGYLEDMRIEDELLKIEPNEDNTKYRRMDSGEEEELLKEEGKNSEEQRRVPEDWQIKYQIEKYHELVHEDLLKEELKEADLPIEDRIEVSQRVKRIEETLLKEKLKTEVTHLKYRKEYSREQRHTGDDLLKEELRKGFKEEGVVLGDDKQIQPAIEEAYMPMEVGEQSSSSSCFKFSIPFPITNDGGIRIACSLTCHVHGEDSDSCDALRAGELILRQIIQALTPSN